MVLTGMCLLVKKQCSIDVEVINAATLDNQNKFIVGRIKDCPFAENANCDGSNCSVIKQHKH